MTSRGNSRTTTLGFRNTLKHVWTSALFKFEAGGVRTDTAKTRRRAVVFPESRVDLLEETASELTAESYFLRGRFDLELSKRSFWYFGGGWDRNAFAGIENRVQASAGVGNLWMDGERVQFQSDYGLSVTRQADVVSLADEPDLFLGLRVTSLFWRQVTTSTRFDVTFILDENLADRKDLRVDLTPSLAVSISEHLALKLSLQLLFDNQPSLLAVGLETPEGESLDRTTRIEADKLDSLLTVALVVRF